MENKNLILNLKEAQGLVQLLDIAVKSGGLQIASSAMYFVDKINKTFQDEIKQEIKKETKKKTKTNKK